MSSTDQLWQNVINKVVGDAKARRARSWCNSFLALSAILLQIAFVTEGVDISVLPQLQEVRTLSNWFRCAVLKPLKRRFRRPGRRSSAL